MYDHANSFLASGRSREESNELIRALCVYDRYNKRIFQWSKANSVEKTSLEGFEKDLASGPLSRTVQQLVRDASLGAERALHVEYKGRDLILYYCGWFLIVADADSMEEFNRVLPLVVSGIKDAVSKDPLSFSELLSENKMPGKSELAKYLEKVLESCMPPVTSAKRWRAPPG
jgi:hypothetical protein